MAERNEENAAVTVESRGHVLLIGLNRAAKRNAFDEVMLTELAEAYTQLEDDPRARVGVLYAHGEHFTGGLDLAKVASRIVEGQPLYDTERAVDPWGLVGRTRSKPLVAAVRGWCLTLGIELLLAADVRIAAEDSRFSQMEVRRGIYPFGGATIRFPREVGWGNAMRWLLTGDEFDVSEAARMGLVQEVTATGEEFDRALWLAERIAEEAAPLAVRTTLESARRAVLEGEREAARRLVPDVTGLFGSADAAEGVQSFMERRPARFTGA